MRLAIRHPDNTAIASRAGANSWRTINLSDWPIWNANDLALEIVVSQHPEGRIGSDKVEPSARRLGMRGVRHYGGAVDRGRVVLGRYVDVTDGIADLLLEDRLRFPGDAGFDQMLHQVERRLAMMDAGEHGLAVAHLGAVDGFRKRFAAGAGERRTGLPRHALE